MARSAREIRSVWRFAEERMLCVPCIFFRSFAPSIPGGGWGPSPGGMKNVESISVPQRCSVSFFGLVCVSSTRLFKLLAASCIEAAIEESQDREREQNKNKCRHGGVCKVVLNVQIISHIWCF